MSVNHHMHPRNIYKTPPNFVKLALEYPEFKKFVKQDLSGKISVNFKEREAVLALTKALLQNDFGLSLTLPENRLVPTLPLRLNYILWLEDLLQLEPLAGKEPVHGVDIGTGAACIYPMLAAKKNNWNMLATEVDGVSVEYANTNVASNELSDLIKVEQVTSDSVLLNVMDRNEDFDFCMCNPPFFSSEEELQCSPERNPPRNAPTGCKAELVAPGGEVEFVKRIIDESIKLGTKIRVYTTMLGKKTSLKHLQTYLAEKGKQISSLRVGTSEFCQGHTTRWGLAWSFLPGLVLPDLVKTRKKNEKKKAPAVATLKNCTLSNAVEKLNALFKELEIHTKLIKENPSKVEMSITAMRNTWSHQRRKRRANRKQNKGEGGECVNGPDKDGDSSDSKKPRLDGKSDGEQESISKPKEVESVSEKSVPASGKDSTVSEKVSPVSEKDPSKNGTNLEKDKMPSNNDDNEGCDDYIGNKWTEIDTLPLLTADLLLQNLGRDVMVAISLGEGCVGGWEVVHQIRQIIINKVDVKKD